MTKFLSSIFRSVYAQDIKKISRRLLKFHPLISTVDARAISDSKILDFSQVQQKVKTSSNEADTTNIEKQSILEESLQHPDFFSLSDLVHVEDLFKVNAHLGHREGTLDNYMKPYVFGSRLTHLVIDLEQTAELFRDALNIVAHIAFRDGVILFVGRYAQHQVLVERTALDCKEFSHTRPWKLGTLTDSNKYLGDEARLPDLIIFLNTMNDALNIHPAVIECAKMLIPSVGIVDTNCDPRLITYPIPGNDDSHQAISYYCKLFKTAIMKGKEKRIEYNLTS